MLLVQIQIKPSACSSANRLTRCCSERPSRSTDQAAMRSNSRRVAAFSMASRSGRRSRPVAPLMPLSSKTRTMRQPDRAANASSSLY
jgi:hypothetical protein